MLNTLKFGVYIASKTPNHPSFLRCTEGHFKKAALHSIIMIRYWHTRSVLIEALKMYWRQTNQ